MKLEPERESAARLPTTWPASPSHKWRIRSLNVSRWPPQLHLLPRTPTTPPSSSQEFPPQIHYFRHKSCRIWTIFSSSFQILWASCKITPFWGFYSRKMEREERATQNSPRTQPCHRPCPTMKIGGLVTRIKSFPSLQLGRWTSRIIIVCGIIEVWAVEIILVLVLVLVHVGGIID